MNEVNIIGHLGGNPELKYTQSGVAVCSFSVATSNPYTDNHGERVDETVWFRVTAWRETGENCHKYLKKGSQVYVKGYFKPPKAWLNTQTGEPQSNYEVQARLVKFLDSASRNNAPDESTVPANLGAEPKRGGENYDDFAPPPKGFDDIPF